MRILGVDRYSIPGPSERDLTDVKVVLVQHDPDYPECAAYRGIGTADFVALHGDKLPWARAALHFPGLAETLQRDGLTYRED